MARNWPDNLKKSRAQQQNGKGVLFNLCVEDVKEFVDDFKRVTEVTERFDVIRGKETTTSLGFYLIFASVLVVSSRTLTVRSICLRNSQVSVK
jgi:hypothetical protein